MKVPSLVFREAIPRDEAVRFGMMRKPAEQEPDPMPFEESAARSALHPFLSLPSFGRTWLVSDRPSVIGYIILTIGLRFAFRGHHAFIDELYIVPAHRGVGRAAMAFVEQGAREMAVPATDLEVERGNDPARELDRHRGYQDHHRLLMTKWPDRAIP